MLNSSGEGFECFVEVNLNADDNFNSYQYTLNKVIILRKLCASLLCISFAQTFNKYKNNAVHSYLHTACTFQYLSECRSVLCGWQKISKTLSIVSSKKLDTITVFFKSKCENSSTKFRLHTHRIGLSN